MKQLPVHENNCLLMLESYGSIRGSEAEPDCECFINPGNGMFALNITLQGPPDNPPFLARLYCRNGRLGRFRISLKEEKINGSVKLYGMINVRSGDIVEWRDKGTINLGLIDEKGRILRLTKCFTCTEFNKALKNYLKTRRKQYIINYLAV